MNKSNIWIIMRKIEDNKIIINRSNLDLTDFDNNKFIINLNRVAFLFILIFATIILYSTRVIYLSSKTYEKKNYVVNKINRADITDRNGNYVSKSVFTTNVGIDPNLVKDKKNYWLSYNILFLKKIYQS